MTEEIHHTVQGYTLDTHGRLIANNALPVRKAASARQRAEKLYATGHYAGIDAYTVTHDEDAGEYGDPVFHARLGQVPEREE